MKSKCLLLHVLLIITCFGLFLSNCKPIDPPDPITSPSDSLVYVLKKQKFDNYVFINHATHFDNLIIIFNSITAIEFDYKIIAIDKTTGNTVWQNDNNGKGYYLPSEYIQDGNYLYFMVSAKIFKLDMRTGATVWSAAYDYFNSKGYTRLSLEAGKLWVVWQFGNPYKGDSSMLFSVNPDNGNMKYHHTWYSKDNDGYAFGFMKIAVYLPPGGDTILVMPSQSYNWNNNTDKADFMAWNISKKESYFDFRRFLNQDYIANGKIFGSQYYINDYYYIALFDMATKQVKWKTDFTNESSSGSDLFFKDGVFGKDVSGNGSSTINYVQINQSNGTIKQLIPIGGENTTLQFDKDTCYTRTGWGEIVKFNWFNGQIYWKYKLRDIHKMLILDAEKRLLYTIVGQNFVTLSLDKPKR